MSYTLDFEIDFIKGEDHSLSDFLTREFLQGKNDKMRFLRVSQ